MAIKRGPHTINDLTLPAGVDGGLLARYRLADGSSMRRLLNELQGALNAGNRRMQKWGRFYTSQSNFEVFYPDGNANQEMPEISDLDRPPSVRGTISGHSLPMSDYGRRIGGSYLFWRRSDLTSIRLEASAAVIQQEIETTFEKRMFERLFSNAEESVGTGYSVPWVAGGTGHIDYSPPAFAGQAFDTTHNHFSATASNLNTAANIDTQIDKMVDHLYHHGHRQPYEMWVADTDIEKYQASSKFIDLIDFPNIINFDRGGETAGPRILARGTPGMDADGMFGGFKSKRGSVHMYAYNRIPTNYLAAFSPSSGAPLRLRVEKSANGFGARVITGASHNTDYPVSYIDVIFTFGFGVGPDRVAVVAGQFGDAAYSTPTIA